MMEQIDEKASEKGIQLEKHIQARLGSRVSQLKVVCRVDGVVLQGRVYTYHAKQLVQHLLMQMTDSPILTNEIEVC